MGLDLLGRLGRKVLSHNLITEEIWYGIMEWVFCISRMVRGGGGDTKDTNIHNTDLKVTESCVGDTIWKVVLYKTLGQYLNAVSI